MTFVQSCPPRQKFATPKSIYIGALIGVVACSFSVGSGKGV